MFSAMSFTLICIIEYSVWVALERRRHKKSDERLPHCIACTRNKLERFWPDRRLNAPRPWSPQKDQFDCGKDPCHSAEPLSGVAVNSFAATRPCPKTDSITKDTLPKVNPDYSASKFTPPLQIFLGSDRTVRCLC